MSIQMTLWGFVSVTSSPESAVGLTPCGLPSGPTTDPCGPEAVHANPSPPLANSAAPTTSATFGPSLPDLLPRVSLQSSLGNKLRQRLAETGSPLYALTWKEWDMQSGPPICALRASARRISGNDSGGGGTPGGPPHPVETGKTPPECLQPESIQTAQSAHASTSYPDRLHSSDGWPTPNAHDPRLGYQRRRGDTKGSQKSLETVAVDALDATRGNTTMTHWKTSGWPTATTMDAASAARHGYMNDGIERKAKSRRKETLTGHSGTTMLDACRLCGPARITNRGEILTGSLAEMDSGGQLNPAHSRWVMGYPPEWCDCAVTVMQSSPKSRKRSSKPSSTP